MKKSKIFIETYGCQMNLSDSEIVASVMLANGYETTTDINEAGIIFLNTCSIREKAEQRIRKRLQALLPLKKKNPDLVVGILGCMAERLKDQLLLEEPVLDIIAGPDSYRDLPHLLEDAGDGQRGINTILSKEETYADIQPVRLDSRGVSAFISIMRGCENYCAYCVVPYVRGKERSRDADSIIQEATSLFESGYREVTLLGQNVNSYQWKTIDGTVNFATLLERVAKINPGMRVRFATSHPKDISDELLQSIAANHNICKAIHLPVQSGSNNVLKRMNRGYTREQYMERIEAIRRIIPGCALSTDIISGFCDESEVDHQQTLSLMEWTGFDFAYMFNYSERPDTLAAKRYTDNIPPAIKEKRLKEVIDLQQKLSLNSNKRDLNKVFEVLIEGPSKRSPLQYSGRTSQNKVVVFLKEESKPGDYVNVCIEKYTSATLIGEVI
ncbi:MAG: tRNA (N6-isopentenyl adenosine(37)-C2)-methylthiotransferase MiaB [Bacteroidetes bacterium]|nr:tRNA (N6-isopentenyl adenosine(37)-C2)-methylthiotransferase MiaB [Bacteroidota bacterium]